MAMKMSPSTSKTILVLLPCFLAMAATLVSTVHSNSSSASSLSADLGIQPSSVEFANEDGPEDDEGLWGWLKSVLREVKWYYMAVGSSAFFFFWESYLDLRQIRHLLSADQHIPPILDELVVIDRQRMKKRNAWGIMRLIYNRMEATMEFIAECLVLSSHLLVWFWTLSKDLLDVLGYGVEYRITRGMIFIILVSLASSLVRVPFHIFRILCVDTHFEMRSAASILDVWFWEQVKMFLFSLLFGIPLLSAYLVLLSWDLPYYWICTPSLSSPARMNAPTHDAFPPLTDSCIYVVILAFFFTDIYHLISPAFDSFKPLPPGPLKTEIEKLTQQLNFPLAKILVVEKYKQEYRSNVHSNAFLVGFRFSKSIVLYDSLIKQLKASEICAIIAHEIGHHKYYHTYKMLFMQIFSMGCFIFLFAHVVKMPLFFRSFGFRSVDPSIGLVLFSYIYSAFANLGHWLTNYVNRSMEYAADEYAVANGMRKLESALIKIHANNLTNLMPDPWYAHYHYSHPSLSERLEYLKRLKREREPDAISINKEEEAKKEQ